MNSQSINNHLIGSPAAYAVWSYVLKVMNSGRLFKGWTVGGLLADLARAAKNGNLLWVCEESGDVTAVALLSVNPNLNHVEVDNWIVEDKKAMRSLMAAFTKRFPGYSVGGLHKNKRLHITPEQQARYFERILKHG